MFITGLGRRCAQRESRLRKRAAAYRGAGRRHKLEWLEQRQMLTGSPVQTDPFAAYEGDSGSTNYEFWVFLTGPISEPLDVAYATSDESAEAGSDYAATSGTLHFTPDGPSAQLVTVEVFGDRRWEPNESFEFTLTPLNGAPSYAVGNIIGNDDSVPEVAISDATVVEGPAGEFSYAEFTITRGGAIGDPLNLAYETIFDTADPNDLPYTGQFITMDADEASRTVLIPIYGDGDIEPDETFFVNLYAFDPVEITDNQGVG